MSKAEDNEESEDVKEWRRQERRSFWLRIARWTIGLGLAIFSIPVIAPFNPFMAPFGVLLGVIIVTPDIAGYLAKVVERMIWLQRPGKVEPMYGIPQTLVNQGRYEEAEQEYEKIMAQFPDEARPHIDMIDIAIMKLNNAELAEQLFQRGMEVLKPPEARTTLEEAYKRIKSRMQTRKDREVAAISRDKYSGVKDRMVRDRKTLWK